MLLLIFIMILLLIFILNSPKNLKVEILFLDNLLEDKQLNDDLRLNILKNLNKYSVQSDKFREKFFGFFI